MTATRPTALVTGASRGIGRATAIALAEAGWDVAITARTVHEGDAVHQSVDGEVAIPGSLDDTSARIEALGGRVVPIVMDLLDRECLAPAVDTAIEGLGHLDALVNNAIYVGPGNDHRFLDIDADILDRRVLGNLTSQLDVTRRALAHMVERGCGTIVNLTSPAGYAAPFALPGKGGWGMPYAVSKAGFHRIAVQVAFEYGDRGIVALNAQPGMVATERIMAVGRSRELIAKYGAPPEVIGRTLAHVVAAANDGPESLPWPNGDTVELQDLAHTLGWLDGPGRFPDPT